MNEKDRCQFYQRMRVFLRDHRVACDISQADVAAAIGMHSKNFNNHENGRLRDGFVPRISLDMFAAWCLAIGADPLMALYTATKGIKLRPAKAVAK